MGITHESAHRFIAILIALAAAALAYVDHREASDTLAKIFFLDIGQGDSIYIRSPSGKDMLIDAGPSNVVMRKLKEAMPWYDHDIDVALETHPDADHIGGFPQILERYEVDMFLEPGVDSKNSIDDEIGRIVREKGIPDELARKGMRIDFGDGSFFDILYPDKDVSDVKNTNSASVVGRFVYGSTSVMLTGDAPRSVERALVAGFGKGLRSDVLKAGHHGSKTSSDRDFVAAVNPHDAVISAGKDNRYHHPHKEVIELLASFKARIRSTYTEGTILFRSDGTEIW